MFWPGAEADIHGRHPDEWMPYDGKVTPDQRVDQVLPLDQRPGADGMDHPAGPEIGCEVDLADRNAGRVVMQWRVGMGADMRRHRDLADVDRTASADLRGPALAVRRVAGKTRRTFVDGSRNVPDTHAHEAKFAPAFRPTVSVIANRGEKSLRLKASGREQ